MKHCMAIVVPESTVVNEVSPSEFRSDEFGPPGGNTTQPHLWLPLPGSQL